MFLFQKMQLMKVFSTKNFNIIVMAFWQWLNVVYSLSHYIFQVMLFLKTRDSSDYTTFIYIISSMLTFP